MFHLTEAEKGRSAGGKKGDGGAEVDKGPYHAGPCKLYNKLGGSSKERQEAIKEFKPGSEKNRFSASPTAGMEAERISEVKARLRHEVGHGGDWKK